MVAWLGTRRFQGEAVRAYDEHTVTLAGLAQTLNRFAKHEGRNAFGFRNPINQCRRIRWACTRQHRQVPATTTELPGQMR